MNLLSRSDPASQSDSQPWALQRQGSLRLSQGLDAWCSCLILHLWIIFSQPASGVLSGVISNLMPSACSCQHLLLWLQWFFCQSSYLVPVCRPCQGFVLGCPTSFLLSHFTLDNGCDARQSSAILVLKPMSFTHSWTLSSQTSVAHQGWWM